MNDHDFNLIFDKYSSHLNPDEKLVASYLIDDLFFHIATKLIKINQEMSMSGMNHNIVSGSYQKINSSVFATLLEYNEKLKQENENGN